MPGEDNALALPASKHGVPVVCGARFRRAGLAPPARYTSEIMDRDGLLPKFAATLRRWAGKPVARFVLPLFVIALIGPLGELIDLAIVSEMEVELLASDLGLEIATTLTLGAYRLLLMLLVGGLAIRGIALLMREAPLPALLPISLRPSPAGKVPIF